MSDKVNRIQTIARGEVRQVISLFSGDPEKLVETLTERLAKIEKEKEEIAKRALNDFFLKGDANGGAEFVLRMTNPLNIEKGAISSRLDRIAAAKLAGEKVGLEERDYKRAAIYVRAAVLELARQENRETLLAMLNTLAPLFPESAKLRKRRARKAKAKKTETK